MSQLKPRIQSEQFYEIFELIKVSLSTDGTGIHHPWIRIIAPSVLERLKRFTSCPHSPFKAKEFWCFDKWTEGNKTLGRKPSSKQPYIAALQKDEIYYIP